MTSRTQSTRQRAASRLVRERVEGGGERVWRFEDFADLPMLAVAQALSRLARAAVLTRLSKGVYYRSRETTFGSSMPNPVRLRALAQRRARVFPAGLAAANLLGFSSQAGSRDEVATSAGSLPRKLVGEETIVHTRRPASWTQLTELEGALLDFLRQAGRTSELTPEETTERTLALLREGPRLTRILKVAQTEPPRVRAMLGAMAEALKQKPAVLARLRESLNPLTKYDFGPFSVLPSAGNWHAKVKRRP